MTDLDEMLNTPGFYRATYSNTDSLRVQVGQIGDIQYLELTRGFHVNPYRPQGIKREERQTICILRQPEGLTALKLDPNSPNTSIFVPLSQPSLLHGGEEGGLSIERDLQPFVDMV